MSQAQAQPRGHESNGGKISRYQVKMLHVLKSKLALSEDEYRERIQDLHGFSGTCKDLSYDEADFIISKWKAEAIEKGVWKNYRPVRSGNRNNKLKYEELGRRPGMASPPQLRMIEAMWKDVSKYHAEDKRARALRKFTFRITGVEDLRFLKNWQVSKIIRALEAMKKHGSR